MSAKLVTLHCEKCKQEFTHITVSREIRSTRIRVMCHGVEAAVEIDDALVMLHNGDAASCFNARVNEELQRQTTLAQIRASALSIRTTSKMNARDIALAARWLVRFVLLAVIVWLLLRLGS